MDDTTSLVSDLLQKLTELDNKVNEYRQDMAQEFRRYSHQRLQNVSGDVSAEVERLIAAQFHNYPALSPALDHVGSHPQGDTDVPSPDEKAWSTKQKSPPASPRSPDVSQDDGTRSPHEREREFHGLFTPSYLPLLEAVQRRSPTPPALPPQVPEVNEPNNDQDTSPDTLANTIPSRPDPVRRYTEDTVSSVASDDSATRSRRSALRRSSSSSIKIQSPRRVRFDVEGEEVLPTSSPPISPRALDFPPSLLGTPTGLLDESYNAIVVSEETDLLGSSPPMPKKITSTDRLKAMARNSTEDTSKWEVVGNLDAIDDDEEDELVMAGLNGRKGHDAYQAQVDHLSSDSTAHQINDACLPAQFGAPLTAVKEVEESEVNEDTNEVDDALMMPALSSFKGKKRFSPPLETTPASESNTSDSLQSTATQNRPTGSSNHVKEPALDEEDMFEFEDNQDGLLSDKSHQVEKYIGEEEEDDDADATPIAEQPVLYSTSPAIPVAQPAPPSPSSASPRHVAASVGSYRGKPFSIGVVRDPELHKKAAEMGDFYTFVGSVDGRSGVDESSSYRPELTYFNGTPRSLSERLIKEDLDEARQNLEANDRH
ncbi:hypothetical protein F5Y04DRAFT_279149 [Hypomontagnella monticulosa]|nr:hypothetical protein F5Y04DRAFT_279149 [Hypomontagnella monticulosa]